MKKHIITLDDAKKIDDRMNKDKTVHKKVGLGKMLSKMTKVKSVKKNT